MKEDTRTFTERMFSMQGRRVLVTGASRGIGRALAVGFAKAGADLVVLARKADALAEVADEIRALGRQVDCIACDQRNVAEIRSAIGGVGLVDVLVNNAGVEDVRASQDVDEALWDKILDTNLKGAFFVAQVAGGPMLERGRGAIINLGSLTSFVGVPTATPYGSSKSGILGMTRALATEWAGQGVRVNAIAPGYFRTEMTEVFYQDKNWAKDMAAKIPLGRFGHFDDLLGATLFLASDASAYITGQCLGIDGGYLASI